MAKLVDNIDDVSVKRYFNERDKLNELLLHEVIYWKQRAKVLWLKEGNENIKFFHASASTRKKTNHVSHLDSDIGIMLMAMKICARLFMFIFMKCLQAQWWIILLHKANMKLVL